VRDGQLLEGTRDQSDGVVLDDLQFLYVRCTGVWLEDRCAVVDGFDQSLPGQEEGFPVLTRCETSQSLENLKALGCPGSNSGDVGSKIEVGVPSDAQDLEISIQGND
jgi:hypothetical protein